MYCPNCGEPIPDGAKFCYKCGASLGDGYSRDTRVDPSAYITTAEVSVGRCSAFSFRSSVLSCTLYGKTKSQSPPSVREKAL